MRLRIPDRGERGAIAVMTAVLMSVLLAVAALAVDITSLVNERQKLYDTVDAAAQAGAYRLPSSGPTAASDARANAFKNDPTLSLPTSPVNAVGLFCVVASKLVGGSYIVDNSQIPATCTPPLTARGGSSPNWTWTGSRCNSKICGIPCDGAGGVCNTIKVTGTKPVPFAFAPAIGFTAPGSTGAVSSVACKGVCGTIPINPMDVVVVADRTGSMDGDDITAMINGIKSMFQVMTPSQQYVSLGTIGRSLQGASSTSCTSTLKALSEPSGSATLGPWVPVPFSTDYLNADKTINAGSTLVNGVECLKNSSGTGTHLASAMKYAARYLLGIDPNNLPVPETRTGTIRKAIIFETDGAPNESVTGGSTTLSDSGDIENTNKDTACTNLKTVASNAKTATPGILVVTVAYNVNTTTKCNGSSGARLDETLAAAASEKSPGVPSAVGTNDCGTSAGRTSENGDGDYFFCAGTGTDMAEIYKTALGQLAKGIRLMRLP